MIKTTKNRRIFFIANNPDVIPVMENKFNLEENDLLITFNKYNFIKPESKLFSHNKYHFLRSGSSFIHGYSKFLKDNCFKKNIEKIYLLSLGDSISIKIKNILSKANFKYEIINFKKEEYNYKSKYSPQSGLLSYLYLKKNFKNFEKCQKYLIGFTNCYKNQKSSLWSGHNKNEEQNFWKKELKSMDNLFKIDHI